jgi:hypothetical protein
MKTVTFFDPSTSKSEEMIPLSSVHTIEDMSRTLGFKITPCCEEPDSGCTVKVAGFETLLDEPEHAIFLGEPGEGYVPEVVLHNNGFYALIFRKV